MTRPRSSAFDLLHPAVALLYFAALLVLAMTAFHPVYLALALAGAFACRVGLRGWRGALRTLRWQLPVIAVIAVANCLFVSTGSTELFRIGTRAFYGEALFYGLCSGTMLCCVLLIFANASDVLSSDKVMAVLGRVLPTVSLMISMTLRLVPQFARRGREIGEASRACTAAAGPRGGEGQAAPAADGGDVGERGRRKQRMGENLRLVTVLMGWGMEDSLETADAMKARGWGAAERRTTYRRERFRRADGLAVGAVALLACAGAAAAWTACAQFSFYPAVEGLAPWYSYAPFALFAFLPSIMGAIMGTDDEGGEDR